MRQGLILLLLGLLPLLAYADIYQRLDSNGIMHYSDMPTPGSTVVNLADDTVVASDNLNSSNTPANATLNNTPASSSSKPAEAAVAIPKEVNYTSLKIVQPDNEATFFNNSGEVTLTVELQPALGPGDKLVVLIDGKPTSTKYNDGIAITNGVERGAHTAQLQVHDKFGKAAISSNSITFYMRRPSVQNTAENLIAPSLQLHPESQHPTSSSIPLHKESIPLKG